MSVESKGEDLLLWSVFVSTSEASKVIVKVELSLFHRLIVEASGIVSPLVWWKANEHCYPSVDFLAKKYLDILRTQIETKRIF